MTASSGSKPVVKHSLRGTNSVERGNRSKNDTVSHLSRQGEDLANMRILLFMTKQNNKVEKRTEHLPGRLLGTSSPVPAKPRDWYVREGLQGRVGSYLASPIVDAAALAPSPTASLDATNDAPDDDETAADAAADAADGASNEHAASAASLQI
mmetsp:Transcript_33513/g.98760  ORF Transcript_33513/g.98760 Transcript_33513/m.98760 type:complete len:153 (-) Transcript_33513:300-758(-)